MFPYLTLTDLQDPIILEYIHQSKEFNYYITDDWSSDMYAQLAYDGFISVTIKDEAENQYLLSEMQLSYAVLNWEHFKPSKRTKKRIKQALLQHPNLSLTINQSPQANFKGIQSYHQETNWLSKEYFNTLLACNGSKNVQVLSIELWDGHQLVAGEFGYIIGHIYTSLTGFVNKDTHSNLGKLQLHALGYLLKKSGISFWNMGHPYMDYKFQMGAIEYQRKDFLTLWKHHRDQQSRALKPHYNLHELFSEW